MAKTIKFNLICDEYPALTIEDLQNHFSVEDLLDYYEKGCWQKTFYTRDLLMARIVENRQSLVCHVPGKFLKYCW